MELLLNLGSLHTDELFIWKMPPLKKVLVVLFALSNIFSTVHAQDLPDFGDPSGSAISPQQLAQIGKRLIRYLRKKNLLVKDPLINQYIISLGYKLVAHSDQSNKKFHFFVVNDSNINAFAAPGGYIGVNRGLISVARSESELAAVMAHEVAHVTQRHLPRMFAANKRRGLISTIALLAVLAAGGGNRELQKAGIVASVAARAQLGLNFTRHNESEADHVGIGILAAAGFNPLSMAVFFERLQKEGSLYGSRTPEFLRTHPVSSRRIADARLRISSLPKIKTRESLNFSLMQMRLAVLSTRYPARLTLKIKKNLKAGYRKNTNATRYGLVLAYTKSRRYAKAKTILNQLLRNDPTRLAYIMAEAEIALGQKNLRNVKAVFSNATALYPDNPVVAHYHTYSLLQLGRNREALAIMRKFSSKNTNTMTPELHNLYARAAGKAGKRGEAYHQRAEYFYRNGYLKTAIRQLTRASQQKNMDFYLKSRIASRLRQFKAEAGLHKTKGH